MKKTQRTNFSQKTQFLFNLSEIIFNVENEENYEKLEIIKNEINEKGFENAALIRISESKSLGGDLGWIEENMINKNLKNAIKDLKIGEFTDPPGNTGGYNFKLKDIKKENISMNIDSELKELIKIKTNQQLNQFSNIYFNKIKDIKIEKFKPIIVVPGEPNSIFLKFFLNLLKTKYEVQLFQLLLINFSNYKWEF